LWPLDNDTEQNIKKFEKTLFHEMAHQWFGNLVTMVSVLIGLVDSFDSKVGEI